MFDQFLRRISLAIGVCLATAFMPGMVAAQDPMEKRNAWQELLTYAGKDLHKLEGDPALGIDRLADVILAGRKTQGADWLQGGTLRLRFVWKIQTPETRVVLLDSPTGCITPGQQVHSLYFFDESGQLLSQSRFSTGWRMCVTDAWLARRGELNLLEFATWGGGGFALAPSLNESFALLNDRAVLIRLATRSGLSRNRYGCPYPAVGPPVPKRTANEWLQALSTENRVESLQALTWIAGDHPEVEDMKIEQEEEDNLRKIYPDDPKSETLLERCPAATDEAILFSEVISRKTLDEKLRRLAASNDDWIKTAADFALQQVASHRAHKTQ